LIRVSITDDQTDFPIDRPWFREVCRFVGERLGVSAELGIAFVSAERMLDLNTRHLGHDYVTDILTFPGGGSPGKLAGELAICPAYGKEMAEEYGLAVHEELTLYVIHGMLHLAGYDDRKPGPKAEMEAFQDRLLRDVLTQMTGRTEAAAPRRATPARTAPKSGSSASRSVRGPDSQRGPRAPGGAKKPAGKRGFRGKGPVEGAGKRPGSAGGKRRADSPGKRPGSRAAKRPKPARRPEGTTES
jgi:probable rRNA maturation factor